MADNLSRASILRWLESLGMPIPRIEDVGKGVVLCRLINLIDGARLAYRDAPATESERLQNLLLVKNYMGAREIRLYFPADRMCKLKMQDNLEVIKWFYSYWEARQGGCASGAPAGSGAGRATRETGAHNGRRDAPIQVALGHPDLATAEAELQEKSKKIAELQEIARVFENERDFYYDKLISIEALLVEGGTLDAGLKERILNIMYEVEFSDG